MHNNSEEKEPDAFEQEMEHRIVNLERAIADRRLSSNAPYSEGMSAGYRYALAIYRECRKDGTI